MFRPPFRKHCPPHVLVIENDHMVLALIRDLLEEEGCQATTQACPEPDLGVVAAMAPDSIVLDYQWADDDTGWSNLQQLHMDPRPAAIPVVLCTGAASDVNALQPRLDQLGG